MEPTSNAIPLVVIVGQTASGKSALAVDLAKRFNGEIIAADSRTVYRGMDIGTAKPGKDDRRAVQHHLLDIVDPDQAFTAADFQERARAAIVDIASRGKVPFLVGGTGLYIDAVIYNFSFRRPVTIKEREGLQSLTVQELRALLEERGIQLPENQSNPRHLVRALETRGEVPGRTGLRLSTLVIGLSKEKADLENRIRGRVEKMVTEGFVDEARALFQRYQWDTPALQTPGYRAFRLYLSGHIGLEEAKQRFVQHDLQYAKRQKTWFKRSKDIIWISNSDEAVDLVTTFLNK